MNSGRLGLEYLIWSFCNCVSNINGNEKLFACEYNFDYKNKIL